MEVSGEVAMSSWLSLSGQGALDSGGHFCGLRQHTGSRVSYGPSEVSGLPRLVTFAVTEEPSTGERDCHGNEIARCHNTGGDQAKHGRVPARVLEVKHDTQFEIICIRHTSMHLCIGDVTGCRNSIFDRINHG